jgi:UDP-N-acetylglucosamine 2-epimerase
MSPVTRRLARDSGAPACLVHTGQHPRNVSRICRGSQNVGFDPEPDKERSAILFIGKRLRLMNHG